MCDYDTYSYSVCEDCYLEHHQGDTGHDIQKHIDRELDGKTGHLSSGLVTSPPENDCQENCGDCYECDHYESELDSYNEEEESLGYEEFSWSACDLCNSSLGGSRHGMTLFVKTN